MANTENTDDDALGCALLIILGIVVSIIGFVVEHWEFFLGLGLSIGAVLAVGVSLRSVIRSSAGRKHARAAAVEQARQAVEQARRAGQEDMHTAWITWQLGSRPVQHAPRPPAAIRERLTVMPKATWNVPQLRMHGRAVWALRNTSDSSPLQQEVEARLDRVAAMISDLTDTEFDTGLGQADDQYLYHSDREIRAAYLEGGARGVEAIMESIIAARAQAREDAAAKGAAEALAQRRNAALRALRETQQVVEAHDAHAAWEEEAKKIDE